MDNRPILLPEQVWANTQLSIARYYGQVSVYGSVFVVCNKEGATLAELSNPKSKYYVREGKAIKAGEPADLVDIKFIQIYKDLKRELFMKLLKEKADLTVKEAKIVVKHKDEFASSDAVTIINKYMSK